jgi:hypothetical protein
MTPVRRHTQGGKWVHLIHVFKSPESEGNCESIRDVSTFETHQHTFKKCVGAIMLLGAAFDTADIHTRGAPCAGKVLVAHSLFT